MLACGTEFVPDHHQRLDKHFHGLKSWAMYQHVAHRISLTLPNMFEEFFGLHIVRAEMHMFKAFMAAYYRASIPGAAQEDPLRESSPHRRDGGETAHGKGYIWVFTNLEEVVYMYRPTREGDFLRELLKDFHGVLVSDFYAAYDLLECPQQKCLIHLMRDINQDVAEQPVSTMSSSRSPPPLAACCVRSLTPLMSTD